MSHRREHMPKRPPIEFTVARKQQYLEALRANGFKHMAADAVGVTDTTVQGHMREDKAFAEAVEHAQQMWIDDRLYRKAIELAVDGVENPIIGGQFRDEIVAHERQYSVPMLTALLKSLRPEFRDGPAGGAASGGRTAGVLMVPAAIPINADDWQKMYGQDAKGQTGSKDQ